MTEKPDKKREKAGSTREARLSAALRANLRKRKDQARGRAVAGTGQEETSQGEGRHGE